MKKRFLLVCFAIVSLYSCKEDYSDLADGLYAKIETNKGDIIVALDYAKSPITVANFVSLAEGKNDFVTNKNLKGRPFFDGLKFHRVIKDFMIQTGDPMGTGSGDAGYKFKDEFSELRFDNGGVLAMANNGPSTNSSQFFITHVATPWLDGKHTIFGHVVGKGMEIVNLIDQNDVMKKVTIIRKGEAAKKFNDVKTFYDYFSIEAEKQLKQAQMEEQGKKEYESKYGKIIQDKVSYFEALKSKATKTATGLKYIITKKGSGKKPIAGTPLLIAYAGFLKDGTLFDTSVEKVAKTFGKYDQQRAVQGGYEPIPFQAGRKDGMIPGFIEGIEQLSFGDKVILYIPSHLAYGAGGAGNAIPPYADIVFEVELLQNK